MKILILVLYNYTPHYKKLLSYWRCYSQSCSDIDVYFITCSKKYEIPSIKGDKFYGALVENYFPNILVKTILAFKYFTGYDFIFRTNISSFVNFNVLRAECAKLEAQGIYRGFYVGDPWCRYASGSGFLISADLAQLIVQHESELDYSTWDDMALGLFLNQYYKLEEISSVMIETPDLEPQTQYKLDAYHYRIKIFANRELEYKFHEYFIERVYYPEFKNLESSPLDKYYKLATKVNFDSSYLNLNNVIRGVVYNGKSIKTINQENKYLTYDREYNCYIGDKTPNTDLDLIITKSNKQYAKTLPNYDMVYNSNDYMVLVKDVEIQNLYCVYVINGDNKYETRLHKLGLKNIEYHKPDMNIYNYYSHQVSKPSKIMAYLQALRSFLNSKYKYGYFLENHNLLPNEITTIFKYNNISYLKQHRYGLFTDKKLASELLLKYDRPFSNWSDNFESYLKASGLGSESNFSLLDFSYLMNNLGAQINIRRIAHILNHIQTQSPAIIRQILNSVVYSELDAIYYYILEAKIDPLAITKIREYLWSYGLTKPYRGLYKMIADILKAHQLAYRKQIESENWADNKFESLNSGIERGTIIITTKFPTLEHNLVWCLMENSFIRLVRSN